MSIPASAPALPSRRGSPVALFGGDVPTLLYSDPAKGGNGSTTINPEKPNVKWGWIAATLNNAFPFNIQAGATVVANLNISAADSSQSGDFEASTLNLKTSGGSAAGVTHAIQPTIITPTITQVLSNVFLSGRLMTGALPFPGLFPQSIYLLPKSNMQFAIQSLSNSGAIAVSPVLFGRRFYQCSPNYTVRLRRRAEMLRTIHPYWIGPQDPSNASRTGPNIVLPAFVSGGQPSQVTLTFPTKSNADFLWVCNLDDSFLSGIQGPPTGLYANISENSSGRSLINTPQTSAGIANSTALGISWTDFLAIPSCSVTGFNSEIRAFSLAGQNCGWTHWIPRNSQVSITFYSTNASPISLNPCLFGFNVYAEQSTSYTSAGGEAYRDLVEQGQNFVKSWVSGQ